MALSMDKFKDAQSVEDVAEILKAEGLDEATAERTWQELTHIKEHSSEELSLEELDAVAGGYDRDWLTDGCAATVEPGSDCWGTDGGCTWVNIGYDHAPGWDPCVFCGAKYTYQYRGRALHANYVFCFKCRECGAEYHYDTMGKLVVTKKGNV